LHERLAAIEGMDIDAALRNVGGHLPMLVRVLRRFASTYRHGLPMLLQTTGSEYEVVARWRLVCHAARGAASAVGAVALVTRVTALEGELRDLQSRASFIAKGRETHAAVIEFVERLAIELAAS
jgi:HPt (histidine-containing phosphotransfer) domain-containing protein